MIILNQSTNTKAKLYHIDTDSFAINIFTEDFFEVINNDVERWFDTYNYDENDKRPLPMGVNKKVIGMFKDELGGKIMKEFCILMFENYKDSLLNNKTLLKSQLRFKSDLHNVCTEEVNKIALSSNDNKKLQTSDRITTYQYGTNAFKGCESEMLSKIRCNV